MTVTPETNTYSLDLAGTTVAVVEERWPGLSIITVTPAAVPLAAGEWLGTTLINSTPASIAGPPLCDQVDDTLGSPGTVTPPAGTMYVYRDIDGRTTTVQVAVTIHESISGVWVGRHSAHLTITIPPAPAPSPQAHYGANVHLFIPNAAGDAVSLRPYLDKLAAAGCDTVVTTTPFIYLCPTSATFDTGVAAQIDTFYADCASRSLRVIANLEITCTETLAGWAGGTTANPWPASLTTVANFVSAYLTRWAAAGITLTNEPNSHLPNHSADRFMRVQAQMYTTAKATRPATLVYCGSLAYGDVGYLEALYTNGLAGKHEGVLIHPYEVRFDRGLSPEIGAPHYPWERDTTNLGTLGKWLPAVHEIYKTMTAHGESGLPVVIGECGWSSSELAANGARCSEQQQADYLAYGVRQMGRCPMLNTLVVYRAYDPPENNCDRAAWVRFGLLHPDATEKPAFGAWAAAIAGVTAGTL